MQLGYMMRITITPAKYVMTLAENTQCHLLFYRFMLVLFLLCVLSKTTDLWTTLHIGKLSDSAFLYIILPEDIKKQENSNLRWSRLMYCIMCNNNNGSSSSSNKNHNNKHNKIQLYLLCLSRCHSSPNLVVMVKKKRDVSRCSPTAEHTE